MPDKRKLQRLIDASIKAHNAVHKADRALNKYCEDTWGFAPSDRDLDNILDSVFGMCGHSTGMSAEEFVADMDKEARNR